MSTPLAWTFGGWEVILLLAVFLLLFGSTKLPKLARSLGSSMTEFKKGLRGEGGEEQKKVESPEEDDASETEKAEKPGD